MTFTWFISLSERFYQLGNTPYIFEDYIRDAVTFSKQEMELIKEAIWDGRGGLDTESEKLGKRETKEFLKKIGD